jgi:glucose-6-phosphate dehydrogenase assembly protein OpcA
VTETRVLLFEGEEVAFSEIDERLQRTGDQGQTTHARSLVGTLVAVGPAERLIEAAEAWADISSNYAIRAILISHGTNPAPPVRISGQLIALSGLMTKYVDNAIAALRLSSLPTVVWFRGGAPEMLDDLVELADRLVLDEADPFPLWRRALTLRERTAFSDVRWTKLTRWRSLMAQFFDIPGVRERMRSFTRLRVGGSDRIAADLYAAWLKTSLSMPVELEFHEHPGPAVINDIRFGDRDQYLTLHLAKSGTCVRTAAVIDGRRSSSRTLSVGDQRLPLLMAEELRIRARDIAFERAIAACVESS